MSLELIRKTKTGVSLLFFMAFIYLKQYLLLDIIVASYDKFVVKILVTKRGLQKASKVPILAVFGILAVYFHTREASGVFIFSIFRP